MSKGFRLQIYDICGDEYRIRELESHHKLIFNRANGFIGPISFIANFATHPRSGHLYNYIAKLTIKFPSDIAPVRFSKKSTVVSMRIINSVIDHFVLPGNRKAAKLKFKHLHEELQRLCTENATVSSPPEPANDVDSTITDDEDDSERDIMMELTSLIEEAMEEPTINEFNRIVSSISNNVLFNQTVAVSKNDDGTLEVIMKDLSPENTDKDYIFAREYLIRVADVDRLIDKLHNKGIIADINGDALTVDDTDFFIDALSYKLMKISERNKENDTNSVSTES